MIPVPTPDFAQLQEIVAEMAHAWNAGDALRYAARFAWDGEQVNIFGAQLHGRHEIAERHDRVFKTIFADSSNVLEIVDARTVSADVLAARVSSVVTVPQGPLQGELRTLASLVLRRAGTRWEIVLFHNTRVTTDASS
jgi:uncharacterized protein (TIGR02246 family)